MAKKGKIFIGTSGWNYKHWKNNFYPEGIIQKKWLEFISQKLNTVEINNSFYRLPAESTFKKWKETVNNNFIFSVKASRYITHMKKLNDPEDSVNKLLKHAGKLGNNLGPILFQLPPNLKYNGEKFENFLKAVSKKHMYTFEFRNKTWWNEEALRLLKKYNSAFCIYELGGIESPKEITADFIYVRLHGPGKKYQGNYSRNILSGWAGAASSWSSSGKNVFIYFDNDEKGYAANNAVALNQMLS